MNGLFLLLRKFPFLIPLEIIERKLGKWADLCVFLAGNLELQGCLGREGVLGGSCCIGVWGCCLCSPLGLPSLDPSFLLGSRLVLTIISIPYIRATQSEVCGLDSISTPENLLEMQIPWLCPDLLNWNLWGGVPVTPFLLALQMVLMRAEV